MCSHTLLARCAALMLTHLSVSPEASWGYEWKLVVSCAMKRSTLWCLVGNHLHWSMEDSEELGVSTGCFPWHGSARLTSPFWSSLFPTVGLTSFPYHYLSWTSVEILSCVGNTFWDCECSCTGPLLSPLNYPFTLPFCIAWHTSSVLNR